MNPDDIEILVKNPLFKGISKENIDKFIIESKAYKKSFNKNEFIYHTGDSINEIGIILSGKLYIENYDNAGNKVIFATISKGGHFGDSYACTEFPIMVDVRATEKSEVLFIKTDYILSDNFSEENLKITKNIINILVGKNMILSKKIRNISHKTIRMKIMSYLIEESIVKNSKNFEINYDRQALADYLNCDRSQLSKEFSKMKDEGLIDYNKNKFEIFF